MVTSSNLIDTPLPSPGDTHDVTVGAPEQPAPVTAGSAPAADTSGPVVDASIANQLARTFRWRRLPWHEQIKASRKANRRSASKTDSDVRIVSKSSETEPSDYISWLFTQCFLVSAVVHAGIFILLATLTYAMTVREGWALKVLPLRHAEHPLEIATHSVQMATTVRDHSTAGASAVTGGVHLPNADAMVGAMSLDEGTHTVVPGRTYLMGEALAILGDQGESQTQDPAEESGAEFFGVQAAGTKFVFVVDCSMSMQGAKWRQARQQLLQAVEQLSTHQSFYVIFFDRDSHLMFEPHKAEPELLPATEQNIVRLRQWTNSFRLGYDTEPFYSVRQALAFWPDAIYLLSDGDFSDPTAAYLRRNNVRHVDGELRMPAVAVHTIGLHNPGGRKLLERIARENRGTHRFVSDPE